MKKILKKTLWLTVGVLSLVAIYITLYQPDQLVDPRFNNISAVKKVSVKKPLAKTPVKASITPDVAANTKTTTTVSKPAATQSTPVAPVTASSTTTDSCAPNATSQDPCKLGQCFGYPYGICESNPNQGTQDKDCASTSTCTDPNANTYDLWGNEFDYQGNLIQASTEQVDPVSGQVNPYYGD